MTLTLTLARAISEIYAVIDRADATEIGFFDGSVISSFLRTSSSSLLVEVNPDWTRVGVQIPDTGQISS